MAHNLFSTLQTFKTGKGEAGQFYSLPQLEKAGVGPVSRLPVSIRVVLESVLRNFDGRVVEEEEGVQREREARELEERGFGVV